MFVTFPIKCIALLLVIVNVIRSVIRFYDKKHPLRYNHLDCGISLALAGSFMLMMSPNILVDAFGLISGLILQVLQIGDNSLLIS